MNERRRTEKVVEQKGDEEGDDGRTDETDGSRRGTSKDRRERTVEAGSGRNNRRRNNPVTTKLYNKTAALNTKR